MSVTPVRSGFLWLFTTFMLLALTGATALAQVTGGTVTGSITDSSGSMVGRAGVRLINNGTGVVNRTASDEIGNFKFLLLPVGTYSLEVTSSGFKTFRRDGIIVETDRSLAVPVALEVGTVSETVVVSAGTPLLDPNTSSLGTIMDLKKVQDLPLNGRFRRNRHFYLGNVCRDDRRKFATVKRLSGGRHRKRQDDRRRRGDAPAG
jgi:hypothetical protein